MYIYIYIYIYPPVEKVPTPSLVWSQYMGRPWKESKPWIVAAPLRGEEGTAD